MMTLTDFSTKAHLLKLADVLNEAKRDYDIDENLFCKKNIFKMGRFIGLYADFMKGLNVLTNDDVEYELNQNDLDFLNQLKSDWDNFLLNIDQMVGFKHLNDLILQQILFFY